ncbi:hypothetical protein [Nonomuraea sp. NPDC023979]|uniref:hypothetical protein n=1 Tax=Nonomuraea sp. NPDC023979 TaxID=3154796 RepID=UPI0033F9BEEC
MSRAIEDASREHLPLTVWLAAADAETAAACEAGCCHPVSGPLARHLIAACTRLGETVVHLGASDHQLVSAALTAGCFPVAVFTDEVRAGVTWTRLARTHPDSDLEITDLRIIDPHDEASTLADLTGSAGLVVAEQHCGQAGQRAGHLGLDDDAEVPGIASAAELVKPGGHLAVVAGLHRQARVADPLPEIIDQVRQAGLAYLQHIIALRQPARGERLHTDSSRHGLAALRTLPERAGSLASARVHSDVLLFTRPKTASESHGPQAIPASGAGSQGRRESLSQAGGES